jgi:hypothetical protein
MAQEERGRFRRIKEETVSHEPPLYKITVEYRDMACAGQAKTKQEAAHLATTGIFQKVIALPTTYQLPTWIARKRNLSTFLGIQKFIKLLNLLAIHLMVSDYSSRAVLFDHVLRQMGNSCCTRPANKPFCHLEWTV